MHYNENSKRLHALTVDGKLRYAVLYPKYKHGEYIVRPLKNNPTFGKMFFSNFFIENSVH